MFPSEANRQTDQQHADAGNPWLLLALVLATFIALCSATLWLPHDPYVRFQQLAPTSHFRTVWAYERLAFDKTPIDIAIIGNSRLQTGISAPVMQARLREQLGRDVHVVNLSMAQEGRNAHYALARELFEHHPEVKLVLLSAIEAMPRESHPAFRNIADVSTVLDSPVVINRAYLDDLAFLPFRQLSLFAQSRFPEAFGLKTFRRSAYYGTDFDTTQSFVSPVSGFVDRETAAHLDELRSTARERVASITPAVLPSVLGPAEFAVEYHYTRKIGELAKASGAAIGFVYLPIFENPEPIRNPGFYRSLGPILQAPCLAGRADIFVDYGHLTRGGAHEVSVMLADRLATLGWGMERGKSATGPVEASLCSQE